jgi:hypothetical protein
MTAHTVEVVAASVDRLNARRADRASALRVLWRESELQRVRKCGRCLAPGNTQGVGLRVTVGDGGRSAGWSGLERCGSVWACPECSAKIAAGRQSEIAAAIRTWQGMGRGLVHLTVTMRHHKGQQLGTLWDALAKAWQLTTSGRGWVTDQKLYGSVVPREVKTGKRKGETVHETRIPVVRVVEVTHGANGWHVHVHALLFVGRLMGETTAQVLGENMFARWSAGLQGRGLAAPLAELGGLHVRVVDEDQAGATFGEYFTKQQYDGPESAAMEIARADLKSARGENRTPFAILRSVYETGDADDLDTWHEWERVSVGRRQIAWSPGLREFLELQAEKSDQELAEEEHAGETLLYVEDESWHRIVCVVPGLRVALLRAAEADDEGERLLALLERHKIGWYRTGGGFPYWPLTR